MEDCLNINRDLYSLQAVNLITFFMGKFPMLDSPIGHQLRHRCYLFFCSDKQWFRGSTPAAPESALSAISFSSKKDAAAIATSAIPANKVRRSRPRLHASPRLQAAQQAPASRIAITPSKSVRTATLYQPILRALRQAGTCFFPRIPVYLFDD